MSKTALVIGACAALLAGAVFFLYLPLTDQIKDQSAAFSAVDNKVKAARAYLKSLEKADDPKALLPANRTSLVINDITRVGKEKGLNFVSLSPQTAGFAEDGRYQYLPVAVEVEGNYQGLGEFLDALSTLEAMTTVDQFDLVPDKENATLLHLKLTVHLYVEPGDAK